MDSVKTPVDLGDLSGVFGGDTEWSAEKAVASIVLIFDPFTGKEIDTVVKKLL